MGAANLMKKKKKTAAILISITLIPSAKYIIPITRKRMSQLSIQASFRKQAKQTRKWQAFEKTQNTREVYGSNNRDI